MRFLVMTAIGLLLSLGASARPANVPADIPVDLRDTLSPSALVDIAGGDLVIRGTAKGPAVKLRVTDSAGRQSLAAASVNGGRFECRYPRDFAEAPALEPIAMLIDATSEADFDTGFQAEAAVILYDSRARAVPDLPSAFTNDLLDSAGRVDSSAHEWPVIRALVNRYMHSRAGRLVRVGRPDFDLARPKDLAFFKKNLSLYDFDYRDRDWSTPLANRPARTFWQAVWDAWFNASNDSADANGRFVAYTFTNDFADNLVACAMRLGSARALDDNLLEMVREATRNLLALQYAGDGSFALKDAKGRQHNYTAGAFRYGMFDNGQFMTEGIGWFANPDHSDYVNGGVFNGRAVWALGEVLSAEPDGPLASDIKAAISRAITFCRRDALDSKYAKRSRAGRIYWRDAGENAYLLLGMIRACSVAPELEEQCAGGLDALLDIRRPHDQWAVYPNVDSMAIIALAEGAIVLRDHPRAGAWRDAAMRAADAWMNAKVDPKQYPAPVVHFGLRIRPDAMTFNWHDLTPNERNLNSIHFYITGHWIHAMARLYALTGEPRYRDRAERMIAYLCGDNPWRVRLFNELGGVYNWVDDTDGDGVEDLLKQDMYPESSAFCQIGMNHLLRVLAGKGR